MKQIICLSTEPWGQVPGRTQHLLSRMRDAQILYFYHSEGREDVTPHRGKKIRPGVVVYSYPTRLQTLSEYLPLFFKARQRMLGQFVSDAAARHRFQNPLLWGTSPEQVHLLNHIDYGSLVFDCDREWDELPPEWEGGLAQAADLVLAASPRLRERLSPCSENIALLENGVNHKLFSAVAAANPGGRPKFGWLGRVHSDLDLSPVLHAAELRPDWSFLFIGDCSPGNPFLPQLKKLENVQFHPRCPLPEVAEQLGRCHVLINLQRLSTAGSDIIPSRVYEYLSTGKPVVTMLLPDEVEPFPDMVYSAQSPEEFLEQCSHALEESPGWLTGRRQSFGSASSWSNRSAQVLQILTTAGLL